MTVDVEPWTGARWPGLPDAWYGGTTAPARPGSTRRSCGRPTARSTCSAAASTSGSPASPTAIDAGYPKPIAGNWKGLPACSTSGIDAALMRESNQKIYFFKGNQYARIDTTTYTMDAGYPKPIAGNWPGCPRRSQPDRRRPAAQGQLRDLLLQGRRVRAVQRGRRRWTPGTRSRSTQLGRSAGRTSRRASTPRSGGCRTRGLPVQGRELRSLHRRPRRRRRGLPAPHRALPQRGGGCSGATRRGALGHPPAWAGLEQLVADTRERATAPTRRTPRSSRAGRSAWFAYAGFPRRRHAHRQRRLGTESTSTPSSRTRPVTSSARRTSTRAAAATATRSREGSTQRQEPQLRRTATGPTIACMMKSNTLSVCASPRSTSGGARSRRHRRGPVARVTTTSSTSSAATRTSDTRM